MFKSRFRRTFDSNLFLGRLSVYLHSPFQSCFPDKGLTSAYIEIPKMLRLTSGVAGRRHARSLMLFLIGFFCSFVGVLFVDFDYEPAENSICAESMASESKIAGLVLVGIMTAAKYVDTRAYTVWKTWGHKFPGKVLFFVAEDTYSIHPDLPLIRLKGVDDAYPPQKKSFAMLRWMYDNYVSFHISNLFVYIYKTL